MRMKSAAAAALLACTFASGADAMRLGEYDGSLADGSTVSLTVDQNPVSGNFRVSGASVTFQDPCTGLGTGTVFASGWTWNPDTDFVDGKATVVMPDNPTSYIKFLANLREGRISGSIEIVNAVLVPDGDKYVPAECGRNQFQRADLSYAGPVGFTPPAPGTAVQRSEPHPVGGAQ